LFTYQLPVLAVLNQKGGVGKTTVSSVLAEYASINLGLSVLVIDLDMQCNSSDYWVGMEPVPTATGGQLPPPHPDFDGDPDVEERSSVADTFFGKYSLPYPTHISPANGFKGKVEILLGHPERLERINTEFDNASGKIDSHVVSRIADLIHQDGVVSEYDIVILDTGPSRNPIFRAALRAATHTIIPFEPEEKSLQGINAMLQAITSENYARSPDDEVKLIGLLPNKVRAGTRIHLNTLAMLREELTEIMCPPTVFLPQSIAYPERDIKGITPRSIFQISPNHKARKQAEIVGDFIVPQLLNDTRYVRRASA